jgi:hypothetical protein
MGTSVVAAGRLLTSARCQERSAGSDSTWHGSRTHLLLRYYFAYGSNLNRGEMSVRCPGANARTRPPTSTWGCPPRYFERIAEGYRDWGLALDALRGALTTTRAELAERGVSRFSRDGRKRLRGVID